MGRSEEIGNEELCQSCHRNPAEPLHICPYQEEINGVTEPGCTCCPECKRECALDI